mgnify:CR=1 FL=1
MFKKCAEIPKVPHKRLELHVFQAYPNKISTMELIVQKLVELGVKKITFQADSVGKYAWASLGFKEEEGRESLAPAFARHLRGLGLVKQAREVEEKNIAPRHIASFTIEGKSVGRSFLLSTDAPMWHAEMRVKRGDPDYEYLRDRVGAK